MKPASHHWDQVKETLLFGLQRRQVVLFVGAGISLWKPSSLPSGRELLEGVIGGLLSGADVASWQRYFDKVYEYPPEIVFQAIRESLPERALLLGIYKALGGSPNFCHLVLGCAASQSWRTLFTTNQDCLIEEAATSHVDVAYTGDQFQLKPDTPQIFKLHGSSGGTTSKEMQQREESILLTLDQMGGGLSGEKQKLMQQAFADKALLFIGYSGGDYDVCQFLDDQLRQGGKHIYWNVRPEAELQTHYRHLWELQERYPDQMTVFDRDLRDLFQDIATAWEVQVDSSTIEAVYCPNTVERRVRLERYVLPWASNLSRFHKLLALGWVLFSTNRPSMAQEVARKAIIVASSRLEQGLGFFLLGYALREQSQHDQALESLRQAYRCFDDTGDQYRKAQVLHKIGELSSTLERVRVCHLVPHPMFHGGLRHFRRAKKLYQANGADEKRKGMQRATEGWALLNEAQALHRIGGVYWQEFIGKIGQEFIDKFVARRINARAKSHLIRARDMLEKIGKIGAVYWQEFIDKFVARRINARAKSKLVRAQDMLEKSGDLRGVAQALIALADIETETGHAVRGGALAGEWTIDLVHQGNSLYRQAAQSEKSGDLPATAAKYEAALQRYQQVGMQAEITEAAVALANLYMKLHDAEKADTFLAICLEAKDKTEGSCIWNWEVSRRIKKAIKGCLQ